MTESARSPLALAVALVPELYLASASPRRRELLRQVGIRSRRLRISVDERPRPGEDARDYVQRLAIAKARAGWEALGRRAPRPVLGADTAVVLDGEILGKPRDRDHGLAMLERLSGRRHRVLSGVAVCWQGRLQHRLQESAVAFRDIGARERQCYWATGEPVDKAGAYAIQGRGALFVKHLEGSYSGVMGLPLYETWELLAALGIELPLAPPAGASLERA